MPVKQPLFRGVIVLIFAVSVVAVVEFISLSPANGTVISSEQTQCDASTPQKSGDRATAAAMFHLAQRMRGLADSASTMYEDRMGTSEIDFSGFYEGPLSVAIFMLRLDGSEARYHLLVAELSWLMESSRGESDIDIKGARRALTAAECAKELAESAGDSATSARAAELLSIVQSVVR